MAPGGVTFPWRWTPAPRWGFASQSSAGNGGLRTVLQDDLALVLKQLSKTSDRRSSARALRVPRSSRSRLEMSTFWISMRCRAAAISRLLFASCLYQVLRSIAKLAFLDTACRLILLSWTCDLSTVT